MFSVLLKKLNCKLTWPIKEFRAFQRCRYLCCFNSILVQVKACLPFRCALMASRFNSILVQVKAFPFLLNVLTIVRFNSILVQVKGTRRLSTMMKKKVSIVHCSRPQTVNKL